MSVPFWLFTKMAGREEAEQGRTVPNPELGALNRARCRRCCRCRSFLVSHWIISIGLPIGGHITLSTYTYHTSPLFETLSTGGGTFSAIVQKMK